jgi:hypothetical protein
VGAARRLGRCLRGRRRLVIRRQGGYRMNPSSVSTL